MGRIQTARFDNLIRRLLSIKGPGAMLSETLEDMFPVLSIEQLPPELLLLAQTHLWGARLAVTGSAGNNGGIQAFNPVGSGNIMVVTWVNIRMSAATNIRWGTVNPRLVSSSIGFRNRDARDGLLISGWGELLSGVAVNTEFFGELRVATAVDRELTEPDGLAVLPPGTGFTVHPTTNALTLECTMHGYTRPAEPSELNF